MDAHFACENWKQCTTGSEQTKSPLSRTLHLGEELWYTVGSVRLGEETERWRREQRERERERAETCRKEGKQKREREERVKREIGRENLLKAFLLHGRETTMETPPEENQDQGQDKRGTNECSQRASSLLFTAVFTGALTYSRMLGFTLHNSWVDFSQPGTFQCSYAGKVLIFHWQKSVHHHLLQTYSWCRAPGVFCFCALLFLWSNRFKNDEGVFCRPRSYSRRDAAAATAAGYYHASVTLKDNEPVAESKADQSKPQAAFELFFQGAGWWVGVSVGWGECRWWLMRWMRGWQRQR